MSGSSPRPYAAGGFLALLALALAGCTSPPASLAPPNLDMICSGEGSPTVVLISGLGTDLTVFDDLHEVIATDTRVCSYSRSGLGESPEWPEDLADPSAGMMADQLRATLDAEEVPGPYVVLGWSYGGLVAQAFAQRHRDATAGVILEDSSVIAMRELEQFDSSEFAEGGRTIDLETTAEELSGLDFGDLPLVVLTRGQPDGATEAEITWWTSEHDNLASRGTNALHLIASDAGHPIHWDSEALVEKAVDTVVASARSGDSLEPCDEFVWVPYGGECPQ